MRQYDANLSRYEKANEWLITYDCFSTSMYSDGDFALLQYLPYTLVPFFPLFNERCAQVERSQTDWEVSKANKCSLPTKQSFLVAFTGNPHQ
jgi:chromosome transmission fidelity protein 18